MDPLLRVGRGGLAGTAPAARLAAARAELARRCAIRLPSLLDPELLEIARAKIDRARFRESVRAKERRQIPSDPSLNALMVLLFNDRAFFRAVERLSGCPPIARLTGGVFRMLPGERHFVDWHSDLGGTSRVMTMTLNLGREPVAGGEFEIRRTGEKSVLARFPYDRGGDAILFRLDRSLRHRSLPVEGTVPKTIFACWFHSERPPRRRG